MNKYLLEVEHYFGINDYFEICANNKEEAISIFLNSNKLNDNHKRNTVKCIKKLKKKG